MKKSLLRIIEIYKPFHGKIFTVVILLMIIQGLVLVSSWLYGAIFDRAVHHQPLDTIMHLIMIAFVIKVVEGTFLPNGQVCYEIRHVSYDLDRHTGMISLRKMVSLSLGQHISGHTGLKQSVINKGESALTQFGYLVFYELAPLAIQVILILAMLLWSHLLLGTIALIGVVIFLALTTYHNLLVIPDANTLKDMEHKNSKFQAEIMRNMKLIQTHAQEDRVLEQYETELKKEHLFGKKIWIAHTVRSGLRSLIVQGIQFSIFAIGAWGVSQNILSTGFLVMFMTLLLALLTQIARVGQFQRRMINQITTIHSFFEFLDTQPEVVEIANPIALNLLGGVEFENVSFAYPKRASSDDEADEGACLAESSALKDISFKILPGQRVVFMGESGAGKSSLLHLLIGGSFPQAGRILIDGVDLRHIALKHYRKQIGLVEQFVQLFSDTLANNIGFGLNGHAKDISKEELDRVAKMACIDRFIGRLEHGYDTVVGEGGFQLSGGERQRVEIARALIKNPKILIFDEATSNLDVENERLICEAIEKAAKGRTTIIITHRQSMAENADIIFYMEKGQLVKVESNTTLPA